MKSRNLFTFVEILFDMEDFRLKVFKAVVQEGSFTKAAKALGITQPAVSQNIAELEKVTGVRLFERRRGEVVLTEQGRVFSEYAERILKDYADVSKLFEIIPSQNVRIAVSDELYAYLLNPVLESFTRVHDLVTFERASLEEADLIISLAPSPDSPFDIYPETIAKVRVSVSPAPKKLGDFAATHERISYFDVLFKPSSAFASTRLCSVLKNHMIFTLTSV